MYLLLYGSPPVFDVLFYYLLAMDLLSNRLFVLLFLPAFVALLLLRINNKVMTRKPLNYCNFGAYFYNLLFFNYSYGVPSTCKCKMDRRFNRC